MVFLIQRLSGHFDTFRRTMSMETPSRPKAGPLEVVGYYSKDGHHTQLCKMSAEATDPYHLGCGRPSKEARAEVQWDNDAQLAVDHASIIVSRLSGQASVYITPDEKGGKAGAGNERHHNDQHHKQQSSTKRQEN